MRPAILATLPLLAVACATPARLPVSAGIGPTPVIPPPVTALIPTVNVVKAKGWGPNQTPIAAAGTRVAAFARGLNHPEFLINAVEASADRFSLPSQTARLIEEPDQQRLADRRHALSTR